VLCSYAHGCCSGLRLSKLMGPLSCLCQLASNVLQMVHCAVLAHL
jgi:hypothetical protein